MKANPTHWSAPPPMRRSASPAGGICSLGSWRRVLDAIPMKIRDTIMDREGGPDTVHDAVEVLASL